MQSDQVRRAQSEIYDFTVTLHPYPAAPHTTKNASRIDTQRSTLAATHNRLWDAAAQEGPAVQKCVAAPRRPELLAFIANFTGPSNRCSGKRALQTVWGKT